MRSIPALVFLLLAFASVGAGAIEDEPAELEQATVDLEEVCEATDSACALALRQLRAQASSAAIDSEAAKETKQEEETARGEAPATKEETSRGQAPATREDKASLSCSSDTGGSCWFTGCSASRGETVCEKSLFQASCLCKPGFCVKNGYCTPADIKDCVKKATVKSCLDWQFHDPRIPPAHRESCGTVGHDVVVTCAEGACWIGEECRLM